MRALAISFAAVAGLVAIAIVYFIAKSDPMGGEPFVVVEIDPESRPDGSGDSASVPDVKEIARAVPMPVAGPSQQTVPTNAFSQGQQSTPETPTPAALPVASGDRLRLPPVPLKDVVESSRYGPLPKVASDGRRPSQVYARPLKGPAKPGPGQPARIALMINGLGLSEIATTQAIESLPGTVTLAFGPYGRNLNSWIRKSRDLGHEVMLQVPLEPFDYPDNDPGPHTLLTSLPPDENIKRLHWIMSRFTGYTGITNHMGAKFAAAQDSFLPMLEEIKSRGLLYLDDGTTASSTAGKIARDLGVEYSVSQIVIDEERNAQEIDLALKKLEGMAQQNGIAIGIGSSLPLTIGRVAAWVGTLKKKGIELIPISAAVRSNQQS